MTVRRNTHLRLCAGAVLLALPVAATSTTAIAGTPSAGAPAAGTSTSAYRSAAAATHPFGGYVAASVTELDPEATAGVARRVRVASERLKNETPLRQVPLDRSAALDLDIPGTALAAYQVAATTMTQADPACGVDWTLLAAIGRVETDHGRHDDAKLKADGVSRPLIRGVALDGRGPVAMVRDSDGGRLDGDKVWDRAVGPMQFLPTTWGYAGVDADGDGIRSPDNLNDAALAAAVFLCAAPGRLDKAEGVRTAVRRYNPSDAYVDLVVRVAKAYEDGDLTRITTGSTTLALDATQVPGPEDATVQATPQTGSGTPSAGENKSNGKGQDNGQGNGQGNGQKNDHGNGDGNNGSNKGNDKGNDKRDDNGPGDKPGKGKGDGELKQPVDPVPGSEDDGSRPGPGNKPAPNPEPEPEPVPLLVDLTGVLVLVEGVPVVDEATGEEVLADQWFLQYDVDGEPAEPLLLDVGDAEWLAAEALADFDGDGLPESNQDELSSLVGLEVDLRVEEGIESAVVHAINGAAYLLP